MSDTPETVGGAEQPQGDTGRLTVAETVARLKAADQKGPVSDAARTMAQAAAAKRAEARQQAEPTEPEAMAEGEDEPQSSDIPEGSDEELPEGEATPEAEEQTEPEPATRGKILVDGVELTADEVKRGYLRQADYTRKTQDLSEKSKALDADRANGLSALESTLTQLRTMLPPEPDWDKEFETDPLGAPRRKLAWDRQQQAIETAEKQLQEGRQTERVTRKRTMIGELADYRSDWKDINKLAADISEIETFAKSLGANQADLQGIDRAWIVKALHIARDKVEAEKAIPKTVETLNTKPRIVKGGARPPGSVNAAQAAVDKAWKSFVQNPSVENSVAWQKAKDAANGRQRNVA